MVGARIPAHLGEGTWVVYHYRVNPAELFYAGPYTPEEAESAKKLFKSNPYRAAGFRSPVIVRV